MGSAELDAELIDSEDDDDFVPPVPVRVDDGDHPSACPACGRELMRHSSFELLRCSDQVRGGGGDDEDEDEADDADDDDDQSDDDDNYGHHAVVARPQELAPPRPALTRTPIQALASIDQSDLPPRVRARLAERAAERAAKNGTAAPPPPPATPAPAAAAPAPQPSTHVDREPTPQEIVESIAPTYREGPQTLPPAVLRTSTGELDLEQLAAALRNVIERERDEVVKRGGPLEKQNQELKERLAGALEEAAKERKLRQAAVTARNALQDQIDRMIKEQRQQRSKKAQQRAAGGTKSGKVELKDILAEVERTPGFTVKRQGNGHYGIYQDGEFVTDAASSGQGYKVDMATRVKLRKVGVNV